MTPRTPPRLLTRLSTLLSEDCEALLGDIFEEYHSGRSNVWMWRQLTWAVVTRGFVTVRRRWPATATASTVADSAIVVVAAFEVVVAATLLDLARGRLTSWWNANVGPPVLALVVAAGLSVMCGVAGVLRARRGRGRLGTAMCYSIGTTILAWLTLLAVQSGAPTRFLPSPLIQLGMAVLCVVSLIGWPHRRTSAE